MVEQLDRQECFDLWVELGSLEKVRSLFYTQGRRNMYGNSYSIYGIRNSALKYMFWNRDVAFERLKSVGSELTREEFDVWCLHKVLKFYGERRTKEWLLSSGMLDPTGEKGYREIYERRFPRLHSE
jgi:hypothetical protein